MLGHGVARVCCLQMLRRLYERVEVGHLLYFLPLLRTRTLKEKREKRGSKKRPSSGVVTTDDNDDENDDGDDDTGSRS